VYDFDDAIWLPNVSPFNRAFGPLKFPGKVEQLIRIATHVTVGNRWLGEHARALHPAVSVIPTASDTAASDPPVWQSPRSGPVTIGWTGTFTTLAYLESLLPVLRQVQQRFGDKVRFKFIGVPEFRPAGLDAEVRAWRAATEVADLRSLDIGLMPLPDSEWVKGKCGCKGLQYMALGIPSVMSPFGVASEIAEDASSGFFPRDDAAWLETLSRLVAEPELRRRVGEAGRVVARERYSVRAWRQPLLDTLRAAAERRRPEGRAWGTRA
jgi:glycosyltransferase involved in cell wall biosynthesis